MQHDLEMKAEKFIKLKCQ